MKVRIVGVQEGQFKVMNAYAIFGEFKPSEPLWYSGKVGQVLEVEPPDNHGMYHSCAYGQGICARDAEVVPETTGLSPICEEEAKAFALAREKFEKERRFFGDLRRKMASASSTDSRKL